jgi:hypothetical protein
MYKRLPKTIITYSMASTKESPFKSFFQYPFYLKVSEKVGIDYVPLLEDALRVVILQLTIQFMYVLRDPNMYNLFDTAFFELILYSVLGVCVYWLIIKRLLIIT